MAEQWTVGKILEGIQVNNQVDQSLLDTPMSGLCLDSRKARPGDIFFALEGNSTNGNHFIQEAIAKGASAVITSAPTNTSRKIIKVSDPKKVITRIAKRFYKNPSEKIKLIGITGTNGKTTTAYLCASLLQSSNRPCALSGTIFTKIGEKQKASQLTTPDILSLHQFLHDAIKEKNEYAVIEVSSHALAQGRTDGLRFESSVFTHLTRDHLDYHSSIEDYYETKQKLFSQTLSQKGDAGKIIIGSDGPYGNRLLQKFLSFAPITFGLNRQAELTARSIQQDFNGTKFQLLWKEKSLGSISSSLLGGFNLLNLLAAAAVGISLNLDAKEICEGLSNATAPPGRFEAIPSPHPFTVLVDYAHTPDGLAQALAAAQGLRPNKILTVFGCGGDRDKGKRRLMGDIAVKGSDRVFITSDNPRTEDPYQILSQIEQGAREGLGNPPEIIEDRKKAIERALREANEGDLVLIAGKGHEDYQLRGTKKIHFDDREVVREILSSFKPNLVCERKN